MPQDPFSEQESFAVIKSMINQARNQFTENGHLYLLWGWVILICSAGHFIMQQVVQVKYYYFIWLLVLPVFIYQVIYVKRKIKQSRVRTYADEMMGYVWLVFSVSTLLLVALLTNRFTNPGYQTIIWLVMYGMPTFLSGVIIRYKALMAGAICCWLLAIASSFVPVQYHMLLLSAAVICGWIIPGYGMQQKFHKQNAITI
jgi:hypothetical protein